MIFKCKSIINSNKKQRQTNITVLIVLFIGIISAANAYESKSMNKISEIIEHKLTIEKQGVGIAAVIIENNKISYLNLGVANKESKQLIDSNTLFEIGSISKTFTALALASMVNEGKIKLTDPVQQYLPDEIKLPIKNGKAITFLSLANHSSGLPRLPTNMPFADPLDPYADYTVEMMVEFLNGYQLPREVGEKTEYSNLGVGLLGHVLAIIDNKSYQGLINSRVLTNLKMDNTFVDLPTAMLARLSDGHNDQLKPTKHWQLPTLAGAGAIKSSAADMALFLTAQMKQQALNNDIELSQTITADFDDNSTKIALAWLNISSENSQYYMHNGGTGGFRSFIGFDKNKQRGIVILANSAFDMDEIGHAYLTDKLDKVAMNTPVVVATKNLVKLNGRFELVPGFILTISHEKEQLFVQATGQAKLSLSALSTTEFVNQAVKAKIVFEVDEQGNAQSLTMYQGGQVLPGVKL
ncbi:MAG: serine hydrolase [Colwellia sp.]|nr:serine hydrolase [Colwellia sp.]